MRRIFGFLFGLVLLLVLAAAGAAFLVFQHYGKDLPDYTQLANYNPPLVTRVHAGDGRVLAEYATQNRVFVPISAIPKRVSNAFISAEDKSFYTHPGIDVAGLGRAVITNLGHLGSDRRPVGASTITQQVAKNFLLTNEVSLARKVKELMLAYRIEHAFSKDRILELYLNEIYLGGGSYGVATAALNYFNKSLDELSVAEAAMLAAMPKAPNNYNPLRHPEAAKARRDWVIGRMLEDGHISKEEATAALAEPVVVRSRGEADTVTADYFAEEVRRELVQRFGEDGLYKGGLSVRTSLDPRLQKIAEKVLRTGLVSYDRRHGWRGPLAHVALATDWKAQLAAAKVPAGLSDWQMAIVTAIEGGAAQIGLADGTEGRIPLAELRWARRWHEGQTVGGAVGKVSDVLQPGDIVVVEAVAKDEAGKAYPAGTYGLRQIPDVSGAIVALDPHTGRVLAMQGGWSFQQSEFNRVTQALRQPGSSFKPFVYMTGLESGFTPSTIIVDAPIVIDQGPGLPLWKPRNDDGEFLGPLPLRQGIEKSRNLMTVRLAQAVGMDKVAALAKRFGVVENLMPTLAMSIGAGETTLLRMATGYAEIVDGGKKVTPTLIDRVQDRQGVTLYRHDDRPCEGCKADSWSNQEPPKLPDNRERIIDAPTTYQMVSMLEGVVQRGTATVVKAVGKPLAGKTGTTNDAMDAWFIGFSPDLVVGVWIGFDTPKTLGPKEYGGVASAPVFRDFMLAALADKPAVPFRVPPGIRLVRVNLDSGQRAQPGDQRVILEAYKPGTEPDGQQQVIGGDSASVVPAGAGVLTGTGASGGTGAPGAGDLY
ncbi:MAG: penicillin-binding protein 1A [Dongiaceae bacterium]